MPATRIVMEMLPWISLFWSTYEVMRPGHEAGNVSDTWVIATVVAPFPIVLIGVGYDLYFTYDELDWRHCLKINDYNGTPSQKMGKNIFIACYPMLFLVLIVVFTVVHDANLGDAFANCAFPFMVMYLSVFKIVPHNPDVLTLEQFEKFCEKHNHTVPEETFLAKMSSTSDVLVNLHAGLVVGIYGSELSSSVPSEIEMAEET